MKQLLVFAYGVASYLVFFATFLYAIGFLGNFAVPTSIDSGPDGPLGTALAIDGALLALFAFQHSIMARPWFKRAWTRIVPEPAERSTYVLLSSLALLLLFWQWRPIGVVIWQLQGAAATAAFVLYLAGYGVVLASSCLISHFDLFGLRQVWLCLIGQRYTHLEFRTPALYKYVRHPLYVGWFMVFWAAPTMTAARLFFAVMATAYILVAVRFEESDLIRFYGQKYRRYQAQTPRFVPSLRTRTEDEPARPEAATAR